MRHNTVIILLLVFTLIGMILSMPFNIMLPIFTDDILKVGATGMGILMSVSGAGAITASIVLASLPNKKRGLMLLISTTILGLTLMGFSFSSSWPFSIAIIIFVGLGQSGHMTLSNTLVQYYVDEEYRGRVMSIMMMQFGIMGFASFAAGLLAETTGVQWAVGGFAMALIFISILALVFVPRIRKLD
jgi:MFS family permease